MSQRFPVGTVPTEPTTCVPAGTYRVRVPQLTEGTTKAGDKLKYDTDLGFQIVAGEHAGQAIRDTNAFIIGAIDANGELADPEDWKKLGGVRLNNLIHSAGGVESEDVDEMLASIVDHDVNVYVNVEKDAAGVYPDKNRIQRFFPVSDGSPAAPQGRPAMRGVPTPVAAPRPAAPASKPAPVATRPAPAAKPAAGPSPSATHICPECTPRNDVPRARLARHLAIHESFAHLPDGERPTFVPADANEEWQPQTA